MHYWFIFLNHCTKRQEVSPLYRVLWARTRGKNKTLNLEARLPNYLPQMHRPWRSLFHHPGKLRPCCLVLAINLSTYRYQHLLYRVSTYIHTHGEVVLATISDPLGLRSQSCPSYGQCGSGAVARADGTVIYLLWVVHGGYLGDYRWGRLCALSTHIIITTVLFRFNSAD